MAITTKLQGGFANQMFQFAMGYHQAKLHCTELILDIGSFDGDGLRDFNLSLYPRIRAFPTVKGSKMTVHENGMPYNEKLVQSIKDGDVLQGYWQTEKYFNKVESGWTSRWDLQEIFQPAPLTTEYLRKARIIKSTPGSTFLTVRRTDYAYKPYHGLMSQDYYREAIKILKRINREISIFVFSDEPEWCKKELDLGQDFQVFGTFPENRTVKGHLGREDAELYLMSLCENAILANSSFSWWGAYLGEPESKLGTIIGPKQWFGTAPEDPRDIIPDRWIKI